MIVEEMRDGYDSNFWNSANKEVNRYNQIEVNGAQIPLNISTRKYIDEKRTDNLSDMKWALKVPEKEKRHHR